MGESLWKFDGYTTAAGKRAVREWFLYVLNEDDRDALRDRMRFLVQLPKNLWMEPAFKNFGGDFGEIRETSKLGALRVYGQFTDVDRFLLLLGCHKKKNKDRVGLDSAKLRLKEFKKGTGSASEFDIEEEPDQEAASR